MLTAPAEVCSRCARPHELFRLSQVFSVLGLVQQGLGVSVSVRLALPEQWQGVVFKSFEPKATLHRQKAMASAPPKSKRARVEVGR